jgi:FkbM family methyltransferase
MPHGLRRTSCSNLDPLEHEMSVRGFIRDGIRKLIGHDSYMRLRYVYRAEHSYLRKIRGVIHIGANAGQERDLYDAFGLHVIWIEPIPEVFEALKINISGFPKQRAYKYLVTGEDGKAYKLHIADNSGASSSILDLSKHTEMYPEIAFKDVITISGTSLGSILAAERTNIRHFAAIVLDTQGSELEILKGATSILPHFRFVKVEVPDFEAYKNCCQIGDLSAFMSSNNFRERSRHLIKHAPGVGSYFDVIYERVRRAKAARAATRLS